MAMVDQVASAPSTDNQQLRSILNSPARFSTTPAVPIPNWAPPPPPPLVTPTPSTSSALPSTTSTDPHSTVQLQNCVATVDLGCELELARINARTRNSEYNPARFHGVVMRLREPRTTALIFRTGKIVCTGARNEAEALLAGKKFARIIQKLNFKVKFSKFKIQNLIATCDLRFPIKLETLNQMHGQFSSYEPELFPGLIYRMVKPRLVLLIFVNGKIVFTGAKTRRDIDEALDNIYPILKSFRKN